MKKENIPCFKLLTNENQKLPKPLIEKKRRARINRSLSDLRVLISDLLKKELMRTRSKRKSGKVEKADVLELAVQYIKEMKQEKSVQKELAFEQGYQKCCENIENYFGKLKEQYSKEQLDMKSKCCEKHQCELKCSWAQKLYLQQKEIIKTLDTKWTEYVQNLNKKEEQQRLMQFDNQEKANTDLNDNLLAANQQFIDKTTINSNFINERMSTLALQNLNSSKNQSFSNSTDSTSAKKFYPLQWKDKPLLKADELMSVKLYNETVMNNLNRNKKFCSSASTTSSCSSASSYAKTVNNLNNYQLNNQNIKTNQLPVMPIDLERSDSHNFSSASSYCSVSSLSSIQSSSSLQSSLNNSNNEIKNSDKINSDKINSDKINSDKINSDKINSDKIIPDKINSDKIIPDKIIPDKINSDKTNSNKQQSLNLSSINQAKYLNSPFKKRKKIYQYAFDTASIGDMNSEVWRPW